MSPNRNNMDKKMLGYFSMIFTMGVCAALIYKDQYLVSGVTSIIYICLIFGVDKIKITKKSVEIENKEE